MDGREKRGRKEGGCEGGGKMLGVGVRERGERRGFGRRRRVEGRQEEGEGRRKEGGRKTWKRLVVV